jgi:hypothetical protein
MKTAFEKEDLLLMMSVPSELNLPRLSEKSAKIIKYLKTILFKHKIGGIVLTHWKMSKKHTNVFLSLSY